jgi:hypothetical protein
MISSSFSIRAIVSRATITKSVARHWKPPQT